MISQCRRRLGVGSLQLSYLNCRDCLTNNGCLKLTNVSPEEIAVNETLEQRVDAVVSELQAAQIRQDSNVRSVVLLIGSLVLFIALGAWYWSFELVLYLLPILLFHELGHYVAMRYFRYRNVKMFFIPLLGAAVSGQHFNVPGWKKAIVSLAGPLPGILLAIPMCVIALKTQNELWRNATLMILLINAFNLLPLLPLDGGWIAHALYFCRQPWLDVLFRLTAAIAMISIGVTWQLFFFTGFGVLMLLAVPAAVRNSNIARRVKLSGLELISVDSQSIPRSTVKKIVAHLPQTGPASFPEPLAQQTRQIYEVVNSRPPGVMATAGLTLLYLAGLAISVCVVVALLFWPQWQQAWTIAPTVNVSSEADVEVYSADQQPVDDHVNRYFVLGICHDTDAVEACVTKLQQHADCRFAFATAGDSVLLSIDRQEAETEAGVVMINAFKASVDSHHWFKSDEVFHFQISCVARDPSQAEKLAHRVDEMLMFGNDLALIDPWSPDSSINDAQFKRRDTRRILDAPFDAASDEALTELSDLLNHSDLVTEDELRQQLERYDRVHEERYEAAVQVMKADNSGAFDQKVLYHWDRRPGRFLDDRSNVQANTMEEERWRLELADLLGGTPGTHPVGINPDDGSIPDSRSVQAFKYSVTAGMISNDGRQIQCHFLHFRNPVTGLPAFLRWLFSNGCEDVQFQILENLDLNLLP